MKLTKPLININGNDAKTLAKELMEVVKHIDDAREALANANMMMVGMQKTLSTLM